MSEDNKRDSEQKRDAEFDLSVILTKQRELLQYIPHGHMIPEYAIATTIAAMGFIEELYECLETLGFRSWPTDTSPIFPKLVQDQLEETADSMFFYAEMMLFQDFTEEEVMKEVGILLAFLPASMRPEHMPLTFTYMCNQNLPYDECRKYELEKIYGYSVSKTMIIVDTISSLAIRTFVFLNACGFKSWRPNPLGREKRLEEFAKITVHYAVFLKYMVSDINVLMSQYDRKWEINRDRWKKAMEGDFSWDKRIEKKSI